VNSERGVYAGGGPLEGLRVVVTGMGDVGLGVEEEVAVIGLEFAVTMTGISGVS